MLIKDYIQKKLSKLIKTDVVSQDSYPAIKVIPANSNFGDYTTNIAMEYAHLWKKSPLTIAQEIQEKIVISNYPEISKVEVAGPGFINFFLSHEFRTSVLKEILFRSTYSSIRFPDLEKKNANKKILIEYVSANPTGPLHVGHGRWAVIGSTLSKILSATGAFVHQEFYVNDTGHQISKLQESVQAIREGKSIPDDGYHGSYIKDLAKLNQDPSTTILQEQKEVLKLAGVNMDKFYHEKSLHKHGLVRETLNYLKTHNLAYQKDGAWWFPSSQAGDDKDRVLVRSNGKVTYFGVDIAYHYNKYKRGYHYLIDVLGADHHGYVKRIQTALKMLSKNQAHLDVVVGQLVFILRGGKPVRMSKRAGNMISLQEVIEEIGIDAFRYFFSMRGPNVPLEFDLELAKEKTVNNPVFYIQYCHARIMSVRKKALSLNIPSLPIGNLNFTLIETPTTIAIVNKLMEWEEEILSTSQNYEIQHLNNYLYDLSTLFHRYYNQEIFVSNKSEKEKCLSAQRLLLLQAIDQVILEGLSLLGISAPDQM